MPHLPGPRISPYVEPLGPSDISSVGPGAYDQRVASPDNSPNQFEVADVRAINTTMMARTQYVHWEVFTKSTKPLPWLSELDRTWDLFEMDEGAWGAADCEAKILAALSEIMALYRTTSISTKILHIKRPRLIPICDSYVTGMIGGRAGGPSATMKLIVDVRAVGRRTLTSSWR
jgi:uncharacterized protein DUF6308